MTFDPELNFDLTTDLVIEIVDNGLLLQTTSLSRPGPSQVIFTCGDSPLVTRFNVSIVIFESLRLEVHPYPQYPGSMDVAVQTLHKIGGTNVFQSGVLGLVVVLSDSVQVDVTENDFTSIRKIGGAGTVSLLGSVITPILAGNVTIQGSFGLRSTEVMLEVTSDIVTVAVSYTHLTLPTIYSV